MNSIQTKNIRKLTLKHPGRRTKEENEELARLRKIHTPRNLKQMLLASELNNNLFANDEDFVGSLMLTFKHFLMDLEHERRIANALDEQDVISRIIETL